MGKIAALWNLFKKGEAVASPGRWKAGQITATMVAGLLMALIQLAQAFGYSHEIPVDADTATTIGAGIVAVGNVILTLVTSRTVGIPGTASDSPSDVPGAVPATQPLPEPSGGLQAPIKPLPGPAVSSVDDATRRRAEEWLRQQPRGDL